MLHLSGLKFSLIVMAGSIPIPNVDGYFLLMAEFKIIHRHMA